MSYYGRLDEEKPKKGVEFMMFEESMEKSLQEKIAKLEQIFESLHKKYNTEIANLIEQTKKLHTRYEWILKMFEKDEIKKKSIDSKKRKDNATSQLA